LPMTHKRVVPIDGSTVSHHAIITLAIRCLAAPLPSFFRRLQQALVLESILPWP
jgi:hypothetical protein